MVFASLIFMLLIAGALISVFKDEFLTKIAENSELSQTTFEAETILSEVDKYGTDWNELSKDLQNSDFRVYIENEKGKEIFNTLKHDEEEVVEGIVKAEISNSEIKLYYLEGTTVIYKAVESDGEIFGVYAADCPTEVNFLGIDRGMFEMFMIIFLITGFISILIIVVFSQFYTKKLIKNILKPVDLLDEATKRMSDGNLDIPIEYSANDEFKAVCESFDFMQKNLKAGIEEKIAYEQSRTEMISGISHDLRTPLTSVKGYIKGIMDGVADNDEKKTQYLNIAYQKACDVDILLSKLFYFSKLETGNMPFFKKKMDIEDFLNNYFTEKENDYREQSIKYELIKEEGEEYYSNIDPQQIKRVFDNIIENSKKYSLEENINIKIELNLVKNEKNKLIQISICDNGKGIEEEKLPKIFNQFFRGDDSRNSEVDGNGLGLYICKLIIEEHDGEISARNKNGFCVDIKLPLIEK